jgi:hypothetical protein
MRIRDIHIGEFCQSTILGRSGNIPRHVCEVIVPIKHGGGFLALSNRKFECLVLRPLLFNIDALAQMNLTEQQWLERTKATFPWPYDCRQIFPLEKPLPEGFIRAARQAIALWRLENG